MTIGISESEILDAIREATESEQGDDGALTMRDIMTATGLSRTLAMQRMHRLNAQGLIQPVRVRRVGLDGRNALVSAYRVIAPKAASPITPIATQKKKKVKR